MVKRLRNTISNSQKASLRAQHHLNPYISNQQLQRWSEETYNQKFDPVSTMTVLLAIRWAIPAWELDLSQETIQNCLKKALADHSETEKTSMGDQGLGPLVKEVEKGIQDLELSNNIRVAMDINQFLNPPDEQVTDSLEDSDDMILSRIAPAAEDSGDENPGMPIPRVSTGEALEGLYKLRLYEEQQVDGNQNLIRYLVQHERILLKNQAERRQQTDIRAYFG